MKIIEPTFTSNYSKRQKLEILRSQLDSERSTFISHWRDLGDYVLPRRPRFYTSDINKGDRRNNKIIDSTATLSARTLRSGLMSGITSPARPWFRLTTPYPELSEQSSVKDWLYKVQQIISTSFLKSNLYNILPIVYGDLGVFGTAPISVEEDFTGKVLKFQSFPIGSYMISKNSDGIVDTFFRDFRMTVRQVIEEFAFEDGKINWDNVSSYIKNLFDIGQTEAWIEVCHVIKPNEEYDPKKAESKYKRYTSVYYERGISSSSNSNYMGINADTAKLLREKGYDYFPILCPRWEVTGEDVYGTSCPGMDALGDIKQLQLGERRLFEAIEKMVRPPMVGPSSLKNQVVSLLPGDITYQDVRDGQQGLRTAHEVNIRIQELEMKQDQSRNRIRRAFFEDLFLMLSSTDRRNITAREIEERHEEKLLALGPVLEQLNQDLLDPLIEISFDIHLRQGLLPKPPEEIQGMPLKVEYLSVMAQSQKLLGISAIERFTGFVGQMASVDQGVLDKIKADEIINVYADITSVPPSIVRSEEDVQAMRQQRAQAQAQAQQAQQMVEATKAAKNLADAKINGEESALDRVIQNAQAGSIA